MKKFVSILLCLVVLLSLNMMVSAHEGHDHENDTTGSSATISPDLDLDQDGIADYEDPIIDIDGDGVGDAGPTYQKPSSGNAIKTNFDFPWLTVICAALFIGLFAATIILKQLSKKKKEEDHV